MDMDQSLLFRDPNSREGSIGHVGIARVRHHLKGQWSFFPLKGPVLGRGIVLETAETSFKDGEGADAEATRDRIMENLTMMIMMRQIVTHGRITPVGVMNDHQLVCLDVVRGRPCVATLTRPSLGTVTGDREATCSESHDHRLVHHDIQLILLLLVLDLIALADEADAVVLPWLSLEPNTADEAGAMVLPWLSLELNTADEAGAIVLP